MELVRRRFRRPRDGTNWWRSGRGSLCDSVLQAMFSIPGDVSVIWVSLYDRPAALRLPVRVLPDGYGGALAIVEHKQDEIPQDERTVNEIAFDKILHPLIGRTVYAAVEYEE